MMNMHSLSRIAAAGLLWLAGAASPASAQSAPADVVQANLLGGWDTGNGTHMSALRVVLADGWKTYWRAPGDAGIPPQFNWSGSDNVAAVRLHWPSPTVFELNGMRTIGYKHELVLPLEITPRDPSLPVRLRGTVDMGVCNDICMPVSLRIGGDLPEPGAPDPVIAAALAQGPAAGREAGVDRVRCSVEPIRGGLRLTAEIEVPNLGAGQHGEVAVFETADPGVWVSESVTRREGGRLVSSSDLLPDGTGPMALDRSQVTITLLGERKAVELKGCPG